MGRLADFCSKNHCESSEIIGYTRARQFKESKIPGVHPLANSPIQAMVYCSVCDFIHLEPIEFSALTSTSQTPLQEQSLTFKVGEISDLIDERCLSISPQYCFSVPSQFRGREVLFPGERKANMTDRERIGKRRDLRLIVPKFAHYLGLMEPYWNSIENPVQPQQFIGFYDSRGNFGTMITLTNIMRLERILEAIKTTFEESNLPIKKL
jgi:hypothetical protein